MCNSCAICANALLVASTKAAISIYAQFIKQIHEYFFVSLGSVFVRLLGITQKRGGWPLLTNFRSQPGTVTTADTQEWDHWYPKS